MERHPLFRSRILNLMPPLLSKMVPEFAEDFHAGPVLVVLHDQVVYMDASLLEL